MILLVFIVLGAVLESLSMIFLTVPIFYPLVLSLDFGSTWPATDAAVTIWFGNMVVVVTEISLISPPIGLNVFVLRSVLSDVPITTIFRGVLPFWMADMVRLAVPCLTVLPSSAAECVAYVLATEQSDKQPTTVPY